MFSANRPGRGVGVIELAITMSIVGMVFVMALKGAALVEAMKAYMVAYQIQNYQIRVFSYQAEYAALPGDDARAPQRFGRENAMFLRGNAAVSMTGNDKIDGRLADSMSPNGEQFMAWRDLRYVGAVPGDPNVVGASAMPENPFGGVYGFDEGNLGQVRGSICATRIPGRAAAIIDKRLDDGIINRGRILATQKYDPAVLFNHFDAPDMQPYDVEKEYIICAPILP